LKGSCCLLLLLLEAVAVVSFTGAVDAIVALQVLLLSFVIVAALTGLVMSLLLFPSIATVHVFPNLVINWLDFNLLGRDENMVAIFLIAFHDHTCHLIGNMHVRRFP
jgi:hypothetical protein